MTRPIFEGSDGRSISRLGYGERQLLRRPATATADIAGDEEIVLQVKVVSDDILLAVGNEQFYIAITEEIDGLSLVACDAWVSTVSSSGVITVQLHNVMQSVDMLSTSITIDQGEFHSKDAATPSVINPGNAVVSWGDLIRVDIDAAGTGARGLGVDFYFGFST